MHCVEDNVPRAKELMFTTGASLEGGYVEVIRYLERKFGGS